MYQIFIFLLEAFVSFGPLAEAVAVNVNKVQGNLTDQSLITALLEKILSLGIKSLRDNELPFKSTQDFITCDKNVLEKLVKGKIIKLRPFLQDDSYNEPDQEDSLTLKGNDETTIIELAANGKEYLRKEKETFKADIKRYEQLKNKIHNALVKESVSEETIDLVIKTMDDMITKIIASQCSWKRNIGKEKVLRVNDDSAEKFMGIVDAWNVEWKKIQEKYKDLFNGSALTNWYRLNSTVISFMEKLPSFFSNVLRDGQMLAKQYTIKCQKINPDNKAEYPQLDQEDNKRKQLHHSFSNNNTTGRTDSWCRNTIWMCSDELKRFLLYIFKSVNTITAKVIKDYIEMYKIDVNAERKYSYKGVVSSLNEVNNELGAVVCNKFAKQLNEFEIDKENIPDSTIKVLSSFIKDVIDIMKIQTKESLEKKLKSMNSELKLNVIGDINVNVKVELERLQKDINTRICTAFETCNSKYTIQNSRRSFSDSSNVFVKVQMTFDDELKNDLIQKSRRMLGLSAIEGKNNSAFRTINNQDSMQRIKKVYTKFVNVTRTTQFYSYPNTQYFSIY